MKASPEEFARGVERLVQQAVDQGHPRTVANPEVLALIGRIVAKAAS